MSSRAAPGGFGLDFKSYQCDVYPEIIVIAQIETPVAVNNAPEIAAVDGIDVLFIGPSDLTHAMGIHGQTTHPLFAKACAKVLEACKHNGRIPGILTRGDKAIREAHGAGFRFIAIGSDLGILATGMKD